jgi:hypothetical protein
LPRRRVFFFCEDSDMGNHPPCNIQALLEHCSTSNHPNDKAFHDIFLAAAGAWRTGDCQQLRELLRNAMIGTQWHEVEPSVS